MTTNEWRQGENMSDMLDCGNCGSAISGSDPRPGYYADGETITCADCGAANSVSVVEEYDGDGVVHDIYVGSWMCVHGRSDDEPCAECAGLAEAATIAPAASEGALTKLDIHIAERKLMVWLSGFSAMAVLVAMILPGVTAVSAALLPLAFMSARGIGIEYRRRIANKGTRA